MDAKKIFLNSLYDEQMGFFCAHEYSSNLEELLQDELNVKQFNLFKEWKESEIATNITESNAVLDTMKLDRIETILEKITARLEVMEEKQSQKSNSQNFNNTDQMSERMTGIETILEKIMIRLDRTEEKINKGNFELSRDAKTLLERTKKMEAFQEKMVIRQEMLEETVKETKQAVIQQGRKAERLQNVPNDSKKLASKPASTHGFKTINIPRVKMLNDYSAPGISVKRGEILNLFDDVNKLMDKDTYLVNVGNNETIGFVPRLGCELVQDKWKLK